ncbi:quinone oxidoreductase family protein [Pseudonocardia spinosispora]|uniref:quinone oxidoreductase family protein n=1 Tax=Pseudonocardia spinosispora TaxID=103441 RepID=UPI0004147A5A|nr:zinc-binding dehydrogenase [Pseudonocardia spinosispora]
MRAVVMEEFGDPDVLVWSHRPDPVPGPGHVVIAVEAAGVNRADLLFRSGNYHRGPVLPSVPGLEAAGTVLAVGEAVEELAPGDRVLAWGATGEPGFYSEQASVPAVRTVRIPAEVPSAAAASLPTAWLSAWYCLHHLGAIVEGQTVLVHAGASGVGSAAVQIAKDAKTRVIATAGGVHKSGWVRDLGADEVLDHNLVDVAAEIARLTDGRGADMVLDLVGGDTFAVSLRSVARAGTVVAMANVALEPSRIDTRDFYPRNVHIHGFQITDLLEHGYDPRPDLRELLAGIAGGRFHVPIDSTYPLSDAAAAHRRLASRAALGKVVLTPGANSADLA